MKSTRGARGRERGRGAAYTSGPRKSQRIKDRFREVREEEEKDKEEEEEDEKEEEEEDDEKSLTTRSSSQGSSRRQSIIIEPNVGGEIIIRSRSHTPIIHPDETLMTEAEDHDSRDSQQHNPQQHSNENKKMLEMMVKQGKQIRALYELLKTTNEKVSWIQNEVKKQDTGSNNLSTKIFSVSKIYRFPLSV